jgi:hypothetical protein
MPSVIYDGATYSCRIEYNSMYETRPLTKYKGDSVRANPVDGARRAHDVQELVVHIGSE